MQLKYIITCILFLYGIQGFNLTCCIGEKHNQVTVLFNIYFLATSNTYCFQPLRTDNKVEVSLVPYCQFMMICFKGRREPKEWNLACLFLWQNLKSILRVATLAYGKELGPSIFKHIIIFATYSTTLTDSKLKLDDIKFLQIISKLIQHLISLP